jgi:uncharacterized protein
MVNSLAYTNLFFLKLYDAALYLFKLNVNNYPDSWNVYDSIGDYYATIGNKTASIDNYKKALSIKQISSTRQKLDAIQGK